MILHANVVLKDLIVHKIEASEPSFSDSTIKIHDTFLHEVLIKYFFKSFKDDQRYGLNGGMNLDTNVVFSAASKIFDNPESFVEASIRLTEHLFECSSHHSIKPGDLFVAYFEDCVLDDEIVDAIGLFKAENKDTFLKIYNDQNSFGVDSQEGININKLDKGALIFNTERESGYTVLTTDNVNKENARYWLDEFLSAKQVQNQYHHTESLINLCQDFVEEVIPESDKAERISVMNESMKYLKSADTFDKQEFEETVLQAPGLIDAFENFREKAIEEEKITPDEQFDISDQAVKKTKRHVRPVIKLDKNFHVYVHGSKENLVKGYDDDKGKNYYTLYFDEES